VVSGALIRLQTVYTAVAGTVTDCVTEPLGVGRAAQAAEARLIYPKAATNPTMANCVAQRVEVFARARRVYISGI
jgi:hypothetical protein